MELGGAASMLELGAGSGDFGGDGRLQNQVQGEDEQQVLDGQGQHDQGQVQDEGPPPFLGGDTQLESEIDSIEKGPAFRMFLERYGVNPYTGINHYLEYGKEVRPVYFGSSSTAAFWSSVK